MVEELFQAECKGVRILLLCTVPKQPPSELPVVKGIRIKNMSPTQVPCGVVMNVRLQLDTTLLEEGHDYSAAFTHQWSNMTYTAAASLLQGQRGVELTVPWQMLAAASHSTTEGLYDVHLIVDSSLRSENRRTLTVSSAESEMSSSSAAQSAWESADRGFAPICHQNSNESVTSSVSSEGSFLPINGGAPA
jgi:hypothetical protein